MALALQHIRLIDGTGHVYERATLLIRGARIVAAGLSRTMTIPRGVTRINGRGLTVIPGLMDCHVHLCLGAEPDVVAAVESDSPSFTLLKSARHARQTLEAGVTTIRDVGSRDHSIFVLKQAIDAEILPGPRIV